MEGVAENRSRKRNFRGGNYIFLAGFLNVPLIGSFLRGKIPFSEPEARQV